MKSFTRFFRCESGATAVEYGLLVALVVMIVIVGIMNVGDGVSDKFDGLSEEFSTLETINSVVRT
ncbi:Flp family type IVb pilin [Pseudahrensia aquimaris]|uniref:Flp family type IVb pilin n=1 Tax=Pseudahrensia aquimaris TaxID=744461 RepID=A0ABW3FFF7_9HYPH